MTTCPFCEMVESGLPDYTIYNAPTYFISLDRESLGFGHCLVIPKQHVVKIYDLSPGDAQIFWDEVQAFARKLEHALQVKAVGYVAFGSGLPHAHLHLVPHDNSRVLIYPHEYVRKLSSDELCAEAEQLRELLGAV
jgi:histidine triad (HIT) family protein